MHEGPAAWL
jgi:hypothetical protein